MASIQIFASREGSPSPLKVLEDANSRITENKN